MHFCLNGKEIFLLDGHTLYHLEDGPQQFFSFTLHSPVSVDAKSTLCASGVPPSQVSLSLSLLPTVPLLPIYFFLPLPSPQLLAPSLSQKAPSVFAFDGLWGSSEEIKTLWKVIKNREIKFRERWKRFWWYETMQRKHNSMEMWYGKPPRGL